MLPLWVEFFEDLMSVRGRSQNTILAYRRDLELFEKFLSSLEGVGNSIKNDRISEDECRNSPIASSIVDGKTSSPCAPFHFSMDDFYSFLVKNQLSKRSQARVISSLRTYSRFCQNRGQDLFDLEVLKLPKVEIGLPQPLSEEEFKALFKASKSQEDEKTARNQITFMLLYGLGCRVSELIDLNLSDFDSFNLELRVVGKGKKVRFLSLSKHLCDNLNHYLENYRDLLLRPFMTSKDQVEEESVQTRAILINDRGHRPSRVDIWRWLAAWSLRAGFPQTVHPHRFRHSCATSLLARGSDLQSIQQHLGHSSIQTVQVYTQVLPPLEI